MANRLTRVSNFRTDFVRRGDVAQRVCSDGSGASRRIGGQGDYGLRIV